MSFYSLVALTGSLAVFLLGNFVYYRDKKAALNRIFAVFCLIVFLMDFSTFMYSQADTFESAYFWTRLGAVWPLAAAVVLQFVLIFTENERFLTRQTYLLIYLPTVAVTVLNFFFSGTPIKKPWGYIYGIPPNLTIFNVIAGWASLLSLMSIALCVNYYLHSKGIKKKQAKYISIGLIVPIFTGVTELALRSFDIVIPETTPLSLVWIAGFTGYAIWRYQLFVISPETTAKEIVSTMPEVLLLLDSDRKIKEANKAALELLGYREEELVGKPARIIFSGGAGKENEFYRKLIRERVVSDHEDMFVTKDNRDIPIILSGSIIKRNSEYMAGIVLVAKNITRRKKLEKSLLYGEKRFRAVADTATDAIISINSKSRIIFFNKAAEKEFGYKRSEILGKTLTVLMPERYKDAHLNGMQRFLRTGEGRIIGKTYEVEALRKDKSEFPIELSVAAWRPNGSWYFTGIIRDITERKKSEEYIAYMAYHDRLTDLPNRRLLEERAGQDIGRAKRENKILAVLYVDIDDFKSVNDTMGHDMGDLLLKDFAKRLRESLRTEDTVARMGGDEFIVLLPAVKTSGDSAVVAEKILEKVSKPFVLNGRSVQISISIGISIYPHDGETASTLISRADNAMFEAKRAGKNRYEFTDKKTKAA